MHRFVGPHALLLWVMVVAACRDRGVSDDSSTGVTGSGGTTAGELSSSTIAVPTGSGPGVDLGAAPGGSLEADYCGPLGALICARLGACGCGALLPAETLDVAACAANYSARCVAAYAQLEAAVLAGEAVILGDQARACVELLAELTPACERPRGAVTQALCPAWFTSDVAIGAACSFPVCAAGEGLCVAGTCSARPSLGQACSPEGICAAGLLCIAGSCAAPVAAGGACVIDDACAPPLRCLAGTCGALAEVGGMCSDTSVCGPGLLCTADSCATRAAGSCSVDLPCGNLELCATPRRCAPRGQLGASCDEDAACVDGLRCDPDSAVCVANPGLGEACVNGVLCAAELACDGDNGVCAPLPGAGQACAFASDGPHVCAAPLGCVAGLCGPLPEAGEACTVDSRCAADLGCDFTMDGSICVPRKAAGGACQTDRTCASGLYCDFVAGQCAPVLASGALCKDGNECGPAGSCLPIGGGVFACGPLPAAGERCVFDCEAPLHCGSDVAAAICAAEVCNEL